MKGPAERPYVIISSTMTVDGKIASKDGYSKFSCPKDLERRDALRAEVDAVMVGANTVIKDDPHLTVKRAKGKNPMRVVVDGKLRSPSSALVFTDGRAPTVLATTELARPNKVKKLRGMGVNVLVLGKKLVNLGSLLRELKFRGVNRLMVEGGGTLNWYMLSQGLVDEIRVTVAPYVVGGTNAITIVEGLGFKDASDMVKLKLVDSSVCDCEREVQLRYLVVKP